MNGKIYVYFNRKKYEENIDILIEDNKIKRIDKTISNIESDINQMRELINSNNSLST